MSFVHSFLEWASYGLTENEDAQKYLLGRGVSREQWERHRLGYIPGAFETDPFRDPNHNPDICRDRSRDYQWCDSCRFTRWSSTWEVEEDGFKTRKTGHRIVGHIVLPLSDYSGNYVGFQVRSLADKSYDTFAVRHRPFGYFFGLAPNLDIIWAKKEVWLTEGVFDHLILERLAVPNVLALTSSSVGRAQSKFLMRFTDVVYWCSDLDSAGRKGLKSLRTFYGEKFEIRDVKYPKIKKPKGGWTKDPGDIWQVVGDKRFQAIFKQLV